MVLYADDTNIFVCGHDKEELINKANMILKCINDYMKGNLLHINNEKCCYVHFKPRNCSHTEESSFEPKLHIHDCEVPEVESTKFLGVTIDNKLSWLPHIDTLCKKLKSACSLLKRMRHNIPAEHFKSIYYALFESHLSYCITVFGNAHKTMTSRLFVLQKHCIRVLFGDLKAFIDKHSTCSRTRSFENQRLGHEFYCKEHTKPLFNEQQILSFRNLYIYQICTETLKILKFKYPFCLYNLFALSSRNNENLLLARSRQSLFVSTRLQIWNSCVKLIIKGDKIFDTNIASFKFKVKKSLLEIQNAFDENEWYPDLNFDINTLTKLTNTAILKVDQSN